MTALLHVMFTVGALGLLPLRSSNSPALARRVVVRTILLANPSWRFVKDDKRTTAAGWMSFRSEDQDISIDISTYPSLLETAHAFELQNRHTSVGGSCLAFPGDDGVDYSWCNAGILRVRTGLAVFQVNVWGEGDCDPKRQDPIIAKRAREAASRLATHLDSLFRTVGPPNPALQRTRFARR